MVQQCFDRILCSCFIWECKRSTVFRLYTDEMLTYPLFLDSVPVKTLFFSRDCHHFHIKNMNGVARLAISLLNVTAYYPVFFRLLVFKLSIWNGFCVISLIQQTTLIFKATDIIRSFILYRVRMRLE